MINLPHDDQYSQESTDAPSVAQMSEKDMKDVTKSKTQANKAEKTSQPKRAKGKTRPSKETLRQKVNRKPPQVTLSLDDDRLELVYSVQQDGQTYKQVMPVADGQFIQSVGGLIEPLVKMTNALLHGEDLRKLNQLYCRDDQGRPTKEPLRVDGQVQFRPNSLDATKSCWQALAQSEAVCAALAQLGNAIDELKQDGDIKLNAQSVSKDDRAEGARIDLQGPYFS